MVGGRLVKTNLYIRRPLFLLNEICDFRYAKISQFLNLFLLIPPMRPIIVFNHNSILQTPFIPLLRFLSSLISFPALVSLERHHKGFGVFRNIIFDTNLCMMFIKYFLGNSKSQTGATTNASSLVLSNERFKDIETHL